MMSQAIERYEQPLALIQSIDDLARLSKQVADSNYYQGTDSAAQASVKLMIARELGLGITSISNIHLVKGKISLGYQILIALVKRSGKYDMRFLVRTEERVEIEWSEDGKVVGRSKFDMDDAKRAGLAGGDNYRKFPIRMLTARAVSDGFNTFAPECAGGALYTEGEIPEDEPVRARPIATPRTAPTPAPRPDMDETVVEAEIVAGAPEDAPSAEASDPAESAPATIDPIEALAAVLKALQPEQRRLVKARTTLLGIKWDAGTPRALVEHFAGDDEGLFAHIATDSEVAETFAEERDNGTFDAEVEAERKARRMAAAGTFGES